MKILKKYEKNYENHLEECPESMTSTLRMLEEATKSFDSIIIEHQTALKSNFTCEKFENYIVALHRPHQAIHWLFQRCFFCTFE